MSSAAALRRIDACCLHESPQNRFGLLATPLALNVTEQSGLPHGISDPSGNGGSTACTLNIKSRRWLKLLPRVTQIEFNEWTPDGHLRHSSFAGLRSDKHPAQIVRE